MSFQFEGSKILGLKIIVPKKFSDNRGIFSETYKKSDFTKNGLIETFVQENRSVSKKNVLRGLHYQINPKAQGKLVSVQRGKIFDVAVDIRRNSLYFGRYVSIVLESEKETMFLIPASFAHAFLSLEGKIQDPEGAEGSQLTGKDVCKRDHLSTVKDGGDPSEERSRIFCSSSKKGREDC